MSWCPSSPLQGIRNDPHQSGRRSDQPHALFSEQTEIDIRQHALESGCFVVNVTAWLNPDQQAQIMKDTGCPIGTICSGCFSAIVSPQGRLMGEPLRSGEGVVIADLDFFLIAERKRQMDSRGVSSRPELLSLSIDRTPVAHLRDRSPYIVSVPEQSGDPDSASAN